MRAYAEYVLPFAFVLIALFPSEPESADAPHIIDFFYSVFLMLLIVVVILGSFTFMTRDAHAATWRRSPPPCSSPPAACCWSPWRGTRAAAAGWTCSSRAICSRSACRWRSGCTCWPSCCRSRRARSASSPRRWRRCCACPRWPGVRWRAGEASRRAGQPHAARGRLRLERARAHHLLALPPQAGAALAPAPARPAARRVLRRQAARGEAAPGELPAGGARDRRAHDARHQEPAAVAERADLGGGARRRRDAAQLQALLRRQLPLIAQRLAETLEKLQRPQESGETYVAARGVVGVARAPVSRRGRRVRGGGAAAGRAAAALAVRQRRRQPDPQRARQARRRRGPARARLARVRRARRAARVRQRRGGAGRDRGERCCARR